MAGDCRSGSVGWDERSSEGCVGSFASGAGGRWFESVAAPNPSSGFTTSTRHVPGQCVCSRNRRSLSGLRTT